MPVSTRALHLLPKPPELRRVLQSLATLDAILCREWDGRRYSFDSRWKPGEQLGSMRDGSGDQWFVLFTADGSIGHGLAHESPMFRPGDPWPGIFAAVPREFAECFVAEPPFDARNSTFCFWWLDREPSWQRGDVAFAPGPDPDGSERLLGPLGNGADGYAAWAAEYFEVDVDPAAVHRIFRHEPLGEELIGLLDPEASVDELAEDLEQIGYPRARV